MHAAPLRLVVLPQNPVLVYTRKSSESDDQQAASHEQQRSEIFKAFGEIPRELEVGKRKIQLWYEDSKSGKTFEARPGFMSMLAFCEQHPQPEGYPGTIYMWQDDRFGRALKSDGSTDVRTMKRYAWRFEDAGWRFQYVRQTRTGVEYIDDILDTLSFQQNADYIVKLSAGIRRGKKDWALKGFWTGGAAPFPAARMEAHSKRILGPGVYSTEPTVLAEDREHPERLTTWLQGADLLLSGGSFSELIRLYTRALPKAKKWSLKALRRMYSNPALVGRMVVNFSDGPQEVPCNWGPIVPVEIFDAVQAELARRDLQSENRRRPRRHSDYLLQQVYCAKCGVRVHGSNRHRNGQRIRRYAHPLVSEIHLAPHLLKAATAAGCTRWTIDANRFESAVLSVIREQQLSPDARERLKARFEQQAAGDTDAPRVEALRAAIKELSRQAANVLSGIALVDEAEDRKALLATHKRIKQERDAAAAELAALEAVQRGVVRQWSELEDLLDQSALMLAHWESLSVAQKRRFFEWELVDVAVNHVGAGKNELLVSLNVDPTSPIELRGALGGQHSYVGNLKHPHPATNPVVRYLLYRQAITTAS